MTVLNFGTWTDVPAEFATLLVTLEEVHRSPGSFVRIGGRQADLPVNAYRYQSEDHEHSFFFGDGGKGWRHGAVSSDAEFLCWSRKQNSGDQTLILCNGTYAAIDDGPELRCKRFILWGEVLMEEGQRTVFAADPEAVEEEALTSSQQPNAAPPNL
jgi:hypothetical protein